MMGMTGRQIMAVTAFVIALAAVPLFLPASWVTIFTLILYFSLVGQAWNLMMGNVGLLSLGHALFLGIGGYGAAILVQGYGLSPWLAIPVAAAVAAVLGAAIAWLGFRFSVKGVYFALLTIAFAEFFRILFNNWKFVGGSGGYFLKVVPPDNNPLLSLRGGADFFYWFFLALLLASLAASAWITRGRTGYFWSAVREDEQAARALGVKSFRYKMLAVAISAFITAIAGAGFTFMNGSLFPETIMSMRMSIEVIIAPIIGGLGTLFGPVVGAVVVVLFLELSNEVGQKLGLFGLNNVFYGLVVFLIIYFLPEGIWPWLRRLLGLEGRRF